ncbi:lipoprotein LpqH [Ktedonospora formicarum]|uniref:Uncharacterized protein n=1 Tax=Ktedonospora formicarum TaxID=2778364 RepID=A0A8J3I9T3_9CHLR|nr:lipoprotein LpqH [Ktedonospora formicarum]GHO47304.1 hypothetical protein KSX_54670 [Ktedonospora formicarum]
MALGISISGGIIALLFLNQQLYAWNLPFLYWLMVQTQRYGFFYYTLFGSLFILLSISLFTRFAVSKTGRNVTWKALPIAWKRLVVGAGILTAICIMGICGYILLLCSLFPSFDHKDSLTSQGHTYQLSLQATGKGMDNHDETATAPFRLEVYTCEFTDWVCTRTAAKNQPLRYSTDLPVYSPVESISLRLSLNTSQTAFLIVDQRSNVNPTITFPRP